MNSLNSLIIEGNLAKDAELSSPTPSFTVARLSLACNRYYKDSNGNLNTEVSFFDVEVYGKAAELCEKNAKKGRGIRVVGRLKQNRWTDEDGKNRSRIIVVCEHIEFKPMSAKTTEVQNANEDNIETVF